MSLGWARGIPRRNHDLTLTNRHVRHRRLMDRLSRMLRAYAPRFDRRYR